MAISLFLSPAGGSAQVHPSYKPLPHQCAYSKTQTWQRPAVCWGGSEEQELEHVGQAVFSHTKSPHGPWQSQCDKGAACQLSPHCHVSMWSFKENSKSQLTLWVTIKVGATWASAGFLVPTLCRGGFYPNDRNSILLTSGSSTPRWLPGTHLGA